MAFWLRDFHTRLEGGMKGSTKGKEKGTRSREVREGEIKEIKGKIDRREDANGK